MTMEEPLKTAATQTAEVQELKEQISILTEQVAALSVKTPRRPTSAVCYRCQQPIHIQWNCPLNRCYICGQAGHIAKHCPLGNGQVMS